MTNKPLVLTVVADQESGSITITSNLEENSNDYRAIRAALKAVLDNVEEHYLNLAVVEKSATVPETDSP